MTTKKSSRGPPVVLYSMHPGIGKLGQGNDRSSVVWSKIATQLDWQRLSRLCDATPQARDDMQRMITEGRIADARAAWKALPEVGSVDDGLLSVTRRALFSNPSTDIELRLSRGVGALVWLPADFEAAVLRELQDEQQGRLLLIAALLSARSEEVPECAHPLGAHFGFQAKHREEEETPFDVNGGVQWSVFRVHGVKEEGNEIAIRSAVRGTFELADLGRRMLLPESRKLLVVCEQKLEHISSRHVFRHEDQVGGGAGLDGWIAHFNDAFRRSCSTLDCEHGPFVVIIAWGEKTLRHASTVLHQVLKLTGTGTGAEELVRVGEVFPGYWPFGHLPRVLQQLGGHRSMEKLELAKKLFGAKVGGRRVGTAALSQLLTDVRGLHHALSVIQQGTGPDSRALSAAKELDAQGMPGLSVQWLIEHVVESLLIDRASSPILLCTDPLRQSAQVGQIYLAKVASAPEKVEFHVRDIAQDLTEDTDGHCIGTAGFLGPVKSGRTRLFHGTDEASASSIVNDGIRVGPETYRPEERDLGEAFYTTNKFGYAAYCALVQAQFFPPVVLVLDISTDWLDEHTLNLADLTVDTLNLVSQWRSLRLKQVNVLSAEDRVRVKGSKVVCAPLYCDRKSARNAQQWAFRCVVKANGAKLLHDAIRNGFVKVLVIRY